MEKIYVNTRKELEDIFDPPSSAYVLFNNSLMRNGHMKVFIVKSMNGKSLYYECAKGDDGGPCKKCRSICNAKFKGAWKWRPCYFYKFLNKHS